VHGLPRCYWIMVPGLIFGMICLRRHPWVGLAGGVAESWSNCFYNVEHLYMKRTQSPGLHLLHGLER